MPSRFDVAVGAILREARIDKGMTQAELAEKSGWSQQMISAVEAGERGIRVEMFEHVCQVLGIRMNGVIALAKDRATLSR